MDLPVNQIIQADCLEVLKTFPDKCVDLVLTDPPYGKKADMGTNGFGAAKNRRYVDDWDSRMPDMQTFAELIRVSKNQIIFGGNYFSNLLPPSNCCLVWDKKGSKSFSNPFADCELIWTSFSRVIRKYTFIQQGFVSVTKDDRVHPTQKPTELFAAIVSDFSKPGDLILDPFLGSGTTAVAAKMEGRNFISIEISEKYCEIARQRVASASVPLFSKAA